MAFNSAGLNAAVDGIATEAAYVSLHSADPGTTGTSELTGGSPAYARKAATWAAASAGERALSADLTFDVAAGSTVAYFGLWDAATAGNFLGGFAVTSETYGAQGEYVLLASATKLDVNAA